MRSLVFWETAGLSTDRSNPYAGLLAQALEPLGVDCVAGFRENLTPDWIRAHANGFDVVHLHWPWGLYYGDTLEEAVRDAAHMMDALLLARSMGRKIVWTMHNLYPHDSDAHELDHLVRLAIVASASAVIVHCEHARRLLLQYFHRRDSVYTIPHGDFIAPYPNTISRADARSRYGLEDHHFVFMFFGTVRANKGVEQLIDCFPAIQGDHVRLLFAARVVGDFSRQVVEKARRADPRIIIYETPRFGNEEFHLFYNAAEIAVFPFTDILTSGSAITSLGFYCPVIVPALGCLPELVDPGVGFLYDPKDPEGLRRALEEAMIHRRDDFRPGIERKLQELNWAEIARKTVEAYRH